VKKYLLILFFAFISFSVLAEDLKIIVPSNDDSYNINARVLSKYYGKYLPEHPNIIIQAIPGAASLTAANYLYNVAPKDGNTIGIVYKEIPFVGLLGGEGVQFDQTKFNWIGSIVDGRKDAVMVWSNETTFRSNFIVGAEGATSGNLAKFINQIMHADFKIVNGYPTTGANRLALIRKEVDAVIYNLIGVKVGTPDWVKPESRIRPVLQFGNGKLRHPDYPNVNTVADYITDENDIELLKVFESQFVLLRPFLAPPGVPEKRVKELREAFEMTMKDPEYLEETKKINLEVSPIDGESAQEIITFTSKADTSIITMLRQIYQVKQ